MPAAHPVARSCAQSAARSVLARFPGASWPPGLLRLYRFPSGLKSLLGSIAWDGTPTIGVNGVTAGHGPDFGTINRSAGRVFVAKVKMTKASTGITGDEHVLGPLYVRNGNLVAKVNGVEATHAHSWVIGDVIYAKVVSTPSGLTVGDI